MTVCGSTFGSTACGLDKALSFVDNHSFPNAKEGVLLGRVFLYEVFPMITQHKSKHAQAHALRPLRRRSLVVGSVVCAFLAIVCLGYHFWCSGAVQINVVFRDTHPERQLMDVSVVVGSDKYFWYTLSAGQNEAVTLWPDGTGSNELTVLYRLDGQQRSWDGPKLDGGVGYRVEIDIDDSGLVTAHQCRLPCSAE